MTTIIDSPAVQADVDRITDALAELDALARRLTKAAPAGYQLSPAVNSQINLAELALEWLEEALTAGTVYHSDADATDLAEYKAERYARYAADPLVRVTRSELDGMCVEQFLSGVRLANADGVVEPDIDDDAWDDLASPVPMPHPLFNGGDAALYDRDEAHPAPGVEGYQVGTRDLSTLRVSEMTVAEVRRLTGGTR